ncbi:MAG: hypothetical protein JRJ62_15370 [Deltaproteobacteria bacterium]|nr:hypothetical protein [Deltaproteobacteria bacterium]
MKDGRVLKVEAELFAINFKYHGHDPAKADLIISCFSKESEVKGVPVVSLHKLWIYEPSPLEKLPPENPLSDAELNMLSTIIFYGPLELSSLAHNEFKGDNGIFMRVPPDFISKLPRGTFEENFFTILTVKTRDYIRKYHHVLIAAGLSDLACETFELLSRKELIKTRPIAVMAAAYHGTIIDHDGWLPTEAYPTENVAKYHKEAVNKKISSFFKSVTED